MAQHAEIATSPCNIDTMAKLVIQPISCDWDGCTVTMNSWHTLQKHLHQHCQINTRSEDVLMICHIDGCLDYKHHSLAMLEEHISNFHLALVHVPCPALGCLHTAAASQSCHSHFLEKHAKLFMANPQGHLFKPQISPLKCQLSPPPPLPLDSSFPSYKLIPYISTSRSHSMPVCKGLNSLTKSISSLRVSYNPDEPDEAEIQKQEMAKKFMASSTPRSHILELDDDIPKHAFTDLLPISISPNSLLDGLKVQLTPIPSNPQVDSILSSPPPWKLQADKPVGMPLTVGYSAFVALYLS